MRFWLLNKIITRSRERGIYAPHDLMFHGYEASRDGEDDIEYYRLGDPLLHPLCLYKNVWDMADVIMPCVQLIIAQRVKARLQGLPSLGFLQVRFEKLFRMPYAAHDRFYVSLPGIVDSDDFIKSVPGDKSLQLEPYFELILPRHHEIERQFRDTKLLDTTVPDSVYFKPMQVRISESMLEKYPIIDHPHTIFMSEAAHARLEPFVDTRYFAWIETIL